MTKQSNLYYLSVFFGAFVFVLSIFANQSNTYGIYIFPFFVLFSIGLMLSYYKSVYGNILNFDSLLVIMFWVFGMSRQLTALFGLESYSSFYGAYTISQYLYAYLFSYLCILAYFVFSYKSKKSPQLTNISEKFSGFNSKSIRQVFLIIFLICLTPLIYYYYKLVSSSLIARYGSRQFDAITEETGYLVSLLRVWGVLSLIIIVSIDLFSRNGKRLVLFTSIYISLSFVSLLSGSRSEGISMLLILLTVFSIRFYKSKTFKFVVIIGLLFISILIPFFYVLRSDISKINEIKIADYFSINSVFNALHEMGGSEDPLLLVMYSNNGLRFGTSYITAALNTLFNFLPSGFRPDFTSIGPVSLASYYSRQLGLNYGLGFSLFAEAYLNFSWFGCLAFGALSLFLRKVYYREMSVEKFLSAIVFSFLILTMPRRESKDLFLSIVYYWLPFEIILVHILGKRIKKHVKLYSSFN